MRFAHCTFHPLWGPDQPILTPNVTHLDPTNHLGFPRQKITLKLIRVQSSCICVAQVTQPFYPQISSRRANFVVSEIWKPAVLPHINFLTVANPPNSPFLNNSPSVQYTPPCVRTLRMNLCFKNTTSREILSTKNSIKKSVLVSYESPNLLSQQNMIKLLKITKSHASNGFRCIQLNPMDFLGVSITQPELSNYRFNILT